MRSDAKRILLAEDETDIAQLVELHLLDAGMKVVHKTAGDESLELALRETFDLLILDLRLPGLSGLEVCRRLRLAGKDLPILMLTAKSTELDRVLGLELGADDYVTKPFSPLELTARVKAILRRASTQLINSRSNTDDNQEPAQLNCGGLAIDSRTRTVIRNGRTIDLTAKEFELLMHFAKSPGRVFSRADLLDQVWGYGHDGYEHTVNSHINRLRAKIEINPANPQKILTIWGIGYKFTPD